ncbi:hypothetical protein BIW11_09603 [Tropilaelaps mercedesae]|uniref:Uncharacterized protein n=1 Tax=Tropilaelaps mercedesae TaxID=418985 RepID=A0A1V9XJN5_9ACAR|nr:hypothetical protein BIW11_09603 [Tropilaelaps mercedesae]
MPAASQAIVYASCRFAMHIEIVWLVCASSSTILVMAQEGDTFCICCLFDAEQVHCHVGVYKRHNGA